MLSVVIPAFNEQEMVPAAAGQIDGILSRAGIPHELIFIDDGSRDATWAEIRAESEHRDTVRGVHFSRNFRKEAAIFAGNETYRYYITGLQRPVFGAVGVACAVRLEFHGAVKQRPRRGGCARRVEQLALRIEAQQGICLGGKLCPAVRKARAVIAAGNALRRAVRPAQRERIARRGIVRPGGKRRR